MKPMKSHRKLIKNNSNKSQTSCQSIPNPCPSSSHSQTQSGHIKNPSKRRKSMKTINKPKEYLNNKTKDELQSSKGCQGRSPSKSKLKQWRNPRIPLQISLFLLISSSSFP
ncbi:hypothetical protein Dimus_038889 [Dionaea muscipula]